MNWNEIPERIRRFIDGNISTVPQLEALLLMWREADRSWSEQEIASRLYTSAAVAAHTLHALHRRRLIAIEGHPPRYRYSALWDASGTLMAEVAGYYRRHVVLIATLIHSQGSAAVREFARAFDLKKDR